MRPTWVTQWLPRGAPPAYSVSGTVHGLASSLFFFVAPPGATLLMARRFRGDGSGWTACCWLAAVGTVAFLLAAFAIPDAAGLLQRIAVVLAHGWIGRVMWRFAGDGAAWTPT